MRTNLPVYRSYLQLVFVEDAQQVVGDELVEASEEGLNFVLDWTRQPVLGQKVKVTQLVLVVHRNARPIRDQVNNLW